jgi:XTP/dITP diphosphohydrolase
VRIVLATGNAGKARELGPMLGGDARVETAPAGFAVDETGETMLQNALLKAAALRPLVPSGALVVADDSGLQVRALGGRPGVRSARYAGESATDADNVRRLLEELDGVEDRRAAFVCVLVAVDARERVSVACGVCPGAIAAAPRGDGGFGYDPVFVPRGEVRSMAEMSPDEKNAVSHRGRAVRRLAAVLGEAA